MVVVDDALLHNIVAGRRSASVQPFLDAVARGEIFTTGSWYWRLTRALEHSSGGALSRVRSSLSSEERERVDAALHELPAEIGLLSLRHLVPVMGTLGGQLNLLTAEAVAAAVVLRAGIAVTTHSPLLDRAARAAGVGVQVVSLHS